VNHQYDIFEKFPDGTIIWLEYVEGLDNAQSRLQMLGGRSPNEHFAMHAPTNEIVARVNQHD